MSATKTRVRQNRRDRRKAKQTGFAREGTKNPKKVAHHASVCYPGLGVGRVRKCAHRPKKKKMTLADFLGMKRREKTK